MSAKARCATMRTMAYDEALANRVRELVSGDHTIVEKPMFGGLAMMINGNMAVVVSGRGGLMVRVNPAAAGDMLAEPGAALTIMRDRPMRGWITVEPAGCAKKADLRRWVNRGVAFARTLPGK